MDPERFDRLVRSLTDATSRRRVLGALAAGALAGLSGAVPGAAQPKRRRKHGRCGDDKGGNADCAHFCADVFPPGKARGQCVSDAARHAGACYQCGPAAPPDSGFALCGGGCVELGTDENCGSCGDACTGFDTCGAVAPNTCGCRPFCNGNCQGEPDGCGGQCWGECG